MLSSCNCFLFSSIFILYYKKYAVIDNDSLCCFYDTVKEFNTVFTVCEKKRKRRDETVRRKRSNWRMRERISIDISRWANPILDDANKTRTSMNKF